MAILESKVIFDHFKASVGFPSLKIIFNGHPGHRMQNKNALADKHFSSQACAFQTLATRFISAKRNPNVGQTAILRRLQRSGPVRLKRLQLVAHQQCQFSTLKAASNSILAKQHLRMKLSEPTRRRPRFLYLLHLHISGRQTLKNVGANAYGKRQAEGTSPQKIKIWMLKRKHVIQQFRTFTHQQNISQKIL